MSGHIRRRGERSWELKYEAGTDARTGKRQTRYLSFKGTKREAEAKLNELLAAVAKGSHIDPNKITIAEFVQARIDQWEGSRTISARSAERYRELHKNQITPFLGAKQLQKLKPLDIEEWHTILRNRGRVDGKGCSASTINHAHRVLCSALNDATENELIVRNVVASKSAPTVKRPDIVIVRAEDISSFVEKMRPRTRYFAATILGLFCGLRLGETLALRWDCIDLDRKTLKIKEALEFTKAHGIRFKGPKSDAGERTMTLPDIVVTTLRQHRQSQMELRLKLGAGRLEAQHLLFSNIDGSPMHPFHYSTTWADCAASIGFPGLSYHCLRHTHASQLIDAGVDVVTIADRLGHASPTVTLNVYAKLFRKDDSKAAEAINAAFKQLP
jgi:integrase